ncbi:MAG: hypothetical protein ACI91F_003277 [Candidatus Binatia bacterium]|jgi:hypothetical protein
MLDGALPSDSDAQRWPCSEPPYSSVRHSLQHNHAKRRWAREFRDSALGVAAAAARMPPTAPSIRAARE